MGGSLFCNVPFLRINLGLSTITLITSRAMAHSDLRASQKVPHAKGLDCLPSHHWRANYHHSDICKPINTNSNNIAIHYPSTSQQSTHSFVILSHTTNISFGSVTILPSTPLIHPLFFCVTIFLGTTYSLKFSVRPSWPVLIPQPPILSQ